MSKNLGSSEAHIASGLPIQQSRNDLALAFGAIALEAGHAIMVARAEGTSTDLKADGSPVTRADLQADALIRSRLASLLPDVPAVTEESFESRSGAVPPRTFVLVDPLDGTREFIAGRDEFTVNIALIANGEPIVGTIYAPAMSRLYVAGTEAFRADIHAGDPMPRQSQMKKLATAPVPSGSFRAVASRSHLDPVTKSWLEEHNIAEFCPAGSSLKFCVIAEGQADVYPRFAPTMEWDTAAGQAILVAAGGCVLGPDDKPLSYGKPDATYRNGPFVAWGRPPNR
jgi:3'(2'), 5'-bisphosphate nucleotidase